MGEIRHLGCKQIKGGVFPVRLKAKERQSGQINWLLDGEPVTATGSRWQANAPDQKTTVQVIANFKQVVKDGELRMHPIVTRLVDAETLEKMGAQKSQQEKGP